MARYIDADALIEVLQGWREDSAMYDGAGNPVDSILYDVIRHIEDAPTADVAPRAEVAREIFEELDKKIFHHVPDLHTFEIYTDLKKKYTQSEPLKANP